MVTPTTPESSFENSQLNPRHDGSKDFHTEDWDALRDTGIPPLNCSALSDSVELREEFLKGARLLGLGTRRMPKLLPQQLLIADAMNAAGSYIALLAPRRSTKTTALFSVAMGRVSSRPGYLACYTMATTATKARQRFKNDIMGPLIRRWPDPKTAPFKIDQARGSESVTWLHPDGETSIFQFLTPKGDAFRSDSWDLIIIDESGEANVEMTEDLEEGAIATMDTRPDATMIVAGTAAEFRDGQLLWKTLEDGRTGKNRTGIVEYAAPPETTIEDLLDDAGEKDWPAALELLKRVHPNVGTLTDEAVYETNFNKLKPTQFLAEYLSIFGRVGGTNFIDFEKFTALADGRASSKVTPPDHFRMAFAVHPLQTSASIVAAWRVKGKAYGLVLESKPGTSWLAPKYLALARKYKVPVVTDVDNSWNASEFEKLQRAKPKPKSEPQKWNQVSTAAATLYREIQTGNAAHFDQHEMNEAVRLAVKRATRESKRWSYGRGAVEENDITSLEAWALALRAYDEAKPRVPMVLITGNAA